MTCSINTTGLGRRIVLGLTLALTGAGAHAQTSGGEAINDINDLANTGGGSLLIPDSSGLGDGIFTSLEADGSYGLFMNTNDYAYNNEADLALITGDESTRHLRQPSYSLFRESGDGDAHVVFTNLTNIGAQDGGNDSTLLQLGTVQKLGPGNLSFGFAYAVNEFDTSFSTNNPSAGIPPVAVGNDTGSTSFEDNRYDLTLGYGARLTDAISLGFSLRSTNSEESESGSAVTPPAFTTVTGSEKDEVTLLTLAGAFRMDMSDRLSWNVRAWYTDEEMKANGNENTTFDVGVPVNVAVIVDNETFELSGSTVGLLGRVNFYRENGDYEVYLGFDSGSLDLDSASSTQTLTVGGVEQGKAVEQWMDDVDDTNYYIGLRGLQRFGKVDFAGALEYGSMERKIKVQTMITEPAAVAPAVTPANTGNGKEEHTYFAIPISLRYHFTDNFSAGAGASWTLNEVDSNLTEQFNVNQTVAPVFIPTETFSSSSTDSQSDYRLFARYDNENFSGQLLWGDTIGNNDDREQIDLSYVSIMVNLSW